MPPDVFRLRSGLTPLFGPKAEDQGEEQTRAVQGGGDETEDDLSEVGQTGRHARSRQIVEIGHEQECGRNGEQLGQKQAQPAISGGCAQGFTQEKNMYGQNGEIEQWENDIHKDHLSERAEKKDFSKPIIHYIIHI